MRSSTHLSLSGVCTEKHVPGRIFGIVKMYFCSGEWPGKEGLRALEGATGIAVQAMDSTRVASPCRCLTKGQLPPKKPRAFFAPLRAAGIATTFSPWTASLVELMVQSCHPRADSLPPPLSWQSATTLQSICRCDLCVYVCVCVFARARPVHAPHPCSVQEQDPGVCAAVCQEAARNKGGIFDAVGVIDNPRTSSL